MPRSRRLVVLLLLPLLVSLLPASGVTFAQEGTGIPVAGPPVTVVRNADLYCAGFISKKKHVGSDFQIVGGPKEDEIHDFTTSNVVYLDYGAKHGASVGENLYVIRPRGKYENPYTGKDIGYYYQELGILRIISVQRNVSTAEVVASCDTMHVGDNIRPFDRYVSPTIREYVPLNEYDLPSGKLSGQIVLGRHFREYLSERDVVYLDIGDDQGVALGQYYTIYRRPGDDEGPVMRDPRIIKEDDDFEKRDYIFEDPRYKGGDFSILGPGKNRRDEVIRDRPGVPRKVVGEICIIRVEEDSATAIITRVTQEVQVGDYVELQ